MKLPRVRLRTILLLINLVILLLPLGGITWLRLYESALIRQTESELIAQTAFIEAAYVSAFERLRTDRHNTRRAIKPETYGAPVTAPPPPRDPEGRWRPRWAELDLASDRVWPRPPDPEPTAQSADPLAVQIGRELTPMLREAQHITLAGMRVVDYRGVIVASTGDGAGDDTGQSLTALEEVREALTGASVSRMRWRNSDSPPPPLESISRGTRIRVYVAEPIEHDGRVLGAILLIRTPANIKQAIYGKRIPLMRAGLGLLALVVLLTLLSSLTISRPVHQLIRQTRRAARGERGAITPLEHPGTREIAELSENVAAMAEALETRSAYIRDFAAHVSHEFKTPLTAIQGSVELLRDHGDGMSTEERTRFLDILSADTARLERLVRRLLELARADMMQAGAEHADLGVVTGAVAQRYLDSGLAVQAAGDPGIEVEIAGDVLDSMLSSLLDNVRQHGGDGVSVRLWWRLSAAHSGRAELHVQDDGSGISAANREKVFEPFFTTARARGSTGMGLAIIRTLLHAHHGEIELLESTAGTHFRIRLPLASHTPS
ncbi:sensor histidine kinase [Sinimarinibacterium sp. CAU 1509]|uniref:sensor histidine kinase n=1 Tax=Sinimarinibacterium sp. CAU 1509 TaxID=2562283 RepID=UPI001B7FB29E|nr:ATP-binding protein [Sinimarinibacterium sp. CAU 1509]